MFQSTIQQQLSLLFYSLTLGAFVGFLNNLFDTVEYVFKQKKHGKFNVLRLVLDLLFSVFYTLVAVVFAFGANSGNVRFFIIFFAVCGFLIYYFSVGRLVYKILCKFVDLLAEIFKIVFSVIKKCLHFILLPILKSVQNALKYRRSEKVQKYILKNICNT